MTDRPDAPPDVAARLREAMASHVAGRVDEAQAGYRGVLALEPDHAEALGMLALILLDGPDPAAAEAVIQRLLTARPDDEAGLLCLGRLRARQGEDAAAAEAFQRVAMRRPGLAPAQKELGAALLRLGRLARAEAAVRAAIAAGANDAATQEQLAAILERDRRGQEALAIRNDLARRAGVQRKGPLRAPADTLAVLGAVGAGHVPTRYLIDPEVFTTLFVGLLSPDQPDAPLGPIDIAPLSQAGAVFNTLGDIHRDWGQLAAAEAICARLGKPVINPPASIVRTGRDAAPALFAGIPGLVVPATWPISASELARRPIQGPVLVRPPGDHGGENLTRLADAAERDAYLADDPDEALLLTDFHDFRSGDGAWRKYRLIFVDRQVFPFHLAVGEHWLLHYWRAEMARSDWKKAEEARFLEDWRGVFGPRAAAAVEAVARRLDLDYGGVDCALLPNGEVLLFEANATILLHLDEPAADFPAKHRRVPPIREAFTRLVRARAGEGLVRGWRPTLDSGGPRA
ncbi:tetratricopeptide repeat protein [Phenylobacterium sp.]|uniref:tetratricopeptide repeat protein n=1 Tax=Phenylobacterium sp. TaxID=1871053 RepID=UPI001205E21E|nr:tetratricopeptide repeat protein [Phenylobacterium sp.]THD58320.1 MAG: tetratricopeptide repeat protein [Phenylobacterium sp.]